MSTVNYSEAWASSVDSWVDISDASCTFALLTTDGNPADSIKLTTTGTSIARGANGPTTKTWQDLGVPAGATVTSVQLTGLDLKAISGAPAGTVVCDIWDSSGASVLSAVLLSVGVSTLLNSWVTKTGSSQTVNTGKQAANTAVRVVITTQGSIGVQIGADNLALTITYTPFVPPPALATAPSRLDVRLYGANGARMSLPDLTALDFEILERGGFGRGSFTTISAWESFVLAGGERVDVWALNPPVENRMCYRGYVSVAERHIEASGERAQPTFYGLMERCNTVAVSRKLAYTDPVDLAQVFTDLVIPDATLRFSCQVDAQTIGVTLQEFDQHDKPLRQALDALCDYAKGLCIWGFDADSLGRDRAYLRPRSATVNYRISVGDGGEVSDLESSSDLSVMVNKIRLTGGKSTQPNLMVNGGFEQVAPGGDSVGNWLLNHGFEDSSPIAWTFTGTIQFPGNGGAFGSARTDSHWMELDTAGEKAEQTVAIRQLSKYRFQCWARLEGDPILHPNSLTMDLEGLNVSNTIVTSISQTVNSVALAASTGKSGGILNSQTYVPFWLELDLSGFATITQLRVRVTSNGGSANNDGVLVDDCSLCLTAEPGQTGWLVTSTGAGYAADLKWAASLVSMTAENALATGPRHGGYCVKLKAAGIASGADCLEIFTRRGAISVKGSERYTIGVWVQTNNLGTCNFSFGVTNVKSDGVTFGTLVESPTWTAASGVNWVLYTLEIATDSDASYLQPFFRVRSNAAIYVDDLVLVQGEFPDEIANHGGWWEADTYQRVIDATWGDLTTVSPNPISSAAAASIATYGYYDGTASNDQVVDYASMLAFAASYFNAHAIPRIQSPITVENPSSLITVDGLIKILNLTNPPAPAFPSRIRTVWRSDGFVEQSIDLSNEQPDMADLLKLTGAKAIAGALVETA